MKLWHNSISIWQSTDFMQLIINYYFLTNLFLTFLKTKCSNVIIPVFGELHCCFCVRLHSILCQWLTDKVYRLLQKKIYRFPDWELHCWICGRVCGYLCGHQDIVHSNINDLICLKNKRQIIVIFFCSFRF